MSPVPVPEDRPLSGCALVMSDEGGEGIAVESVTLRDGKAFVVLEEGWDYYFDNEHHELVSLYDEATDHELTVGQALRVRAAQRDPRALFPEGEEGKFGH